MTRGQLLSQSYPTKLRVHARTPWQNTHLLSIGFLHYLSTIYYWIRSLDISYYSQNTEGVRMLLYTKATLSPTHPIFTPAFGPV